MNICIKRVTNCKGAFELYYKGKKVHKGIFTRMAYLREFWQHNRKHIVSGYRMLKYYFRYQDGAIISTWANSLQDAFDTFNGPLTLLFIDKVPHIKLSTI